MYIGSGTRRRRSAPHRRRIQQESELAGSKSDNPLIFSKNFFDDNIDDPDNVDIPIIRPREASESIDGNREPNYVVLRQLGRSGIVELKPSDLCYHWKLYVHTCLYSYDIFPNTSL